MRGWPNRKSGSGGAARLWATRVPVAGTVGDAAAVVAIGAAAGSLPDARAAAGRISRTANPQASGVDPGAGAMIQGQVVGHRFLHLRTNRTSCNRQESRARGRRREVRSCPANRTLSRAVDTSGLRCAAAPGPTPDASPRFSLLSSGAFATGRRPAGCASCCAMLRNPDSRVFGSTLPGAADAVVRPRTDRSRGVGAVWRPYSPSASPRPLCRPRRPSRCRTAAF